MRIAVAHTLDPEHHVAAEDLISSILQQLDGAPAQLGLLYSAIDVDHAVLLNAIMDAFPSMLLIGCSTDGEASHSAAFNEDSSVLTVFTGIEVRTAIARGLSKDADGALRRAVAEAELPNAKLAIVLPDSLTVSTDLIVRTLNDAVDSGVTVIGGTAGDQWQFQQTRQFFGREVCSDACPIAVIGGDFDFGIGVAGGWRPMGVRATITKAVGNVVRTIDGAPALEFFHRGLGGEVSPNPEYPIGVWEGRQFYIRAPMGFDSATGTVTFAGDVPQGAEVQLTQGTRDDILAACDEAIQGAVDQLGSPPDALLFFTCSARKQVLGTRTSQEMDRVLAVTGRIPVSGFYTYGEIAPLPGRDTSAFHNETFVTLALKAR